MIGFVGEGMPRVQRRSQFRTTAAIVIVALAASLGACSSLPGLRGRGSIRLSELVDQGDPVRRASHRLLIEGLEADAAGAHARAKGRYERAMQLDSTNPYVYLTFARFEVERQRPAQARAYLDKTYALFDASGGLPHRVEAHVIGLSGAVEAIRGNRTGAARELERARRLAPAVWGDAYLSAEELL